MQRYFAKNKENNTIFLKESDIHHIKNVMRMNLGDKIEVVYNKVLYVCNIDSIEPLELSIDHIEDKEKN